MIKIKVGMKVQDKFRDGRIVKVSKDRILVEWNNGQRSWHFVTYAHSQKWL